MIIKTIETSIEKLNEFNEVLKKCNDEMNYYLRLFITNEDGYISDVISIINVKDVNHIVAVPGEFEINYLVVIETSNNNLFSILCNIIELLQTI